MQQVLSPGVQHSQEADLCPQMLRVCGDGAQRLRGRAEQDVVDRGLVLECDGGDRLGYGEHHVEVRHVEQFRMAVRKPLRTGETLALRTVPIAAGNGKFPLAALWANPVMGSRRPA
jgi:hypothetical protein